MSFIPAQIKEEPGRIIENQRPVQPQVVGSLVKPSNVGNNLISLPLTDFVILSELFTSRKLQIIYLKHEYLAAYQSSGWMFGSSSSGWMCQFRDLSGGGMLGRSLLESMLVWSIFG